MVDSKRTADLIGHCSEPLPRMIGREWASTPSMLAGPICAARLEKSSWYQKICKGENTDGDCRNVGASAASWCRTARRHPICSFPGACVPYLAPQRSIANQLHDHSVNFDIKPAQTKCSISFGSDLHMRRLGQHDQRDEPNDTSAQQIPDRCHGIAGHMDQPGDDQLRGAAEHRDRDGIDRREYPAANGLRQALSQRAEDGA